MPDWNAIQAEYETGGISLRALAAKHEVAPTTLHDRSRKWARTTNAEQSKPAEQIRLLHIEQRSSPANAVEGANLGIDSMITYLKAHRSEMDLNDHAKAAQALWQYNRIVVNAPPDVEDDQTAEDYSDFSDEDLAVYAELQERAKKRKRA